MSEPGSCFSICLPDRPGRASSPTERPGPQRPAPTCVCRTRLEGQGSPSPGVPGVSSSPTPSSTDLNFFSSPALEPQGKGREGQGGEGGTAWGDKVGMGRSDKGGGREAGPTSSPIGTPPQGAPAFCCVYRKALRWRSGWEGSRRGQDMGGLGRGPFRSSLVCLVVVSLRCSPGACPHRRPAAPLHAGPAPLHAAPDLEGSSQEGEGEQAVPNPDSASHQLCNLGSMP